MTTTINVNKQSVSALLGSGRKRRFIIPQYQRPYAWTDAQIQTLFEDLVDFTENDPDAESDEISDNYYFLGTVVSFDNDQHEQEIIDGQQRITSLFLLLRAFYTKLQTMTQSAVTKHLTTRLASILWRQDNLSGEIHFDQTLITSRAIGDEGNQLLNAILQSGVADSDATDHYSLNYRLFQDLIEDYAQREPMWFYHLIVHVLDQAILLPITADSEDTALTIFSTLNDRGLALSDADIFKAKMYNHQPAASKDEFILEWQQLETDAAAANESLQKLFYYYMFYLRAKAGDQKSTTPGIRKYYSQNKFERLYEPDLMTQLGTLLRLWQVVNVRDDTIKEPWAQNMAIRRTLDILTSYPNEFWKYPVVAYYLSYHEQPEFEPHFLAFLHQLTAVLCMRYVITPTINAVKTDILNLDVATTTSMTPQFDFAPVNPDEFSQHLKTANRNIVRMILKTLAYQHQDELLPAHWEIEHIFPQSWQDSFFNNRTKAEVEAMVEHIGNKLPFEKRLNIKASNGYFERKRSFYQESHIELVRYIATNHQDWGLDDISERDIRISDALLNLFQDWQDGETAPTFTITVPAERQAGYARYLESLNSADSDEMRQEYLSHF